MNSAGVVEADAPMSEGGMRSFVLQKICTAVIPGVLQYKDIRRRVLILYVERKVVAVPTTRSDWAIAVVASNVSTMGSALIEVHSVEYL